MTNGWRRRWTRREDDYMSAHHLRLTCDQMAGNMPGRTPETIKRRLSILGLRAFMSQKNVDPTRKPEPIDRPMSKTKKRRTCLAYDCNVKFDSGGPGHRLCQVHRKAGGYDFEEPYAVAGGGR